MTRRFALWFAAIALLPMSALGFVLLRAFDGELQEAAKARVSAIADKKTKEIQVYVQERIDDARLVAAGNTARDTLRQSARALAESGADSAEYRRAEALHHNTFGLFADAMGCYDVFLVSAHGIVVYSLRRESDLASDLLTGPQRGTGLAKVVRRALDKRQASFSDFDRYAPSGNAISAFAAAPIVVDGKLEGVLALQVDVARIWQSLTDRTGLGATGEIVVARRQDPRTALVMAPLRRDPDAGLRREFPLRPSGIASAMRNALVAPPGSGMTMDYAGVPVVAAWRKLPALDWGLVVKMDVAEALAPIARVRTFSLSMLVLALVAAVAGAALLGRRIVAPLKNLSRAAQGIAAGDLEARVPVDSRDELGQLALSFNAMATELALSNARHRQTLGELRRSEAAKTEANESLERLVSERTAALRRSEALFRSLADDSTVGVYRDDAAGTPGYVNARLCELVGMSREAIGREGWVSAIHPGDRERVVAAWTHAKAAAQPFVSEHRLLHADGKVVWALVHSQPELGADGEVIGDVGTLVDITARKQAEDAVREALHEKETLLKEIHHRVKNNLQIISSLLAMQADAAPDAAARGALQEGVNRVRSMALIHEQLYQSATLARIDFGEYARALAGVLVRSYGGAGAVQLALDVAPMELNVETAVPCALILNELVTNALKHAFKDGRGGELTVAVQRSAEGGCTMAVRDTGPGLPPGFEIAKAKSLGLQLVAALTKQIKGTLTIASADGASFSIAFKELTYAAR